MRVLPLSTFSTTEAAMKAAESLSNSTTLKGIPGTLAAQTIKTVVVPVLSAAGAVLHTFELALKTPLVAVKGFTRLATMGHFGHFGAESLNCKELAGHAKKIAGHAVGIFTVLAPRTKDALRMQQGLGLMYRPITRKPQHIYQNFKDGLKFGFKHAGSALMKDAVAFGKEHKVEIAVAVGILAEVGAIYYKTGNLPPSPSLSSVFYYHPETLMA